MWATYKKRDIFLFHIEHFYILVNILGLRPYTLMLGKYTFLYSGYYYL